MASTSQGIYSLDVETLKLNAYRLLCLFYANKEIARRSHPDRLADTAAILERRYFTREMTHLLLTMAVSLRVLDDQMSARAAKDPKRKRYIKARSMVDELLVPAGGRLTLREICNKIIHALSVRPEDTEATGEHELDTLNRTVREVLVRKNMDPSAHLGDLKPIKWRHLTGNIHLTGVRNGKVWLYTLHVPLFVSCVDTLLEEGVA